MTGYGRQVKVFENKNITVEIKALNSKQADINTRIPPAYRCVEIEINNLLKSRLERGKIDCFITVSFLKGNAKIDINENLFKTYYSQLKQLTAEVGADDKYLTEYLLKRDDISQTEEDSLSEEEKAVLLACVNEAVNELDSFRLQEGAALKEDFKKRVDLIETLSAEVAPFEQNRVPQIKDKLLSRLEELRLTEIDSSRLEQELIYYLEKLDITEERTRLAQHIKYFRQTIEAEESIGKKMGFITQEMGREINTLGSKSNDAQMQQIVVKMKDELEKIKEQLANVL